MGSLGGAVDPISGICIDLRTSLRRVSRFPGGPLSSKGNEKFLAQLVPARIAGAAPGGVL